MFDSGRHSGSFFLKIGTAGPTNSQFLLRFSQFVLFFLDSIDVLLDSRSKSLSTLVANLGFCFGHLIHNCLLLARQILHFSSSDDKLYEECADSVSLVLYTLSPIYSFYQLYILFKYSNVSRIS